MEVTSGGLVHTHGYMIVVHDLISCFLRFNPFHWVNLFFFLLINYSASTLFTPKLSMATIIGGRHIFAVLAGWGKEKTTYRTSH